MTPALVLVVDDNPINLQVLFDALESEGLDIAVASDGEMALECIRRDPPDLILLDALMPDLDGFEICRRLKADPATRDIPVIFMTSLTETQYRLEGFSAGAVDYVTKPIERAELVARVLTHISLWGTTRALKKQGERLSWEIRERIVAEQALAAAIQKLESAMEELGQTNARLSQELERREQAEAARVALQEQVLAVQRETAHREGQMQIVRGLIENSMAVIYVKDTEGRYLLANCRFQVITHLSPTQIVGRTDHDLFPAEIADDFQMHDNKVLAEGMPIEAEEVAPLDDGLHTFISLKFPLYSASGTPYGVCGISTDISERKRGEDTLRLLASASRILSTSLDYDTTAKTAARLPIPDLAVACVLVLPSEHRSVEDEVWQAPRCIVAHADADKQRLAQELLDRSPGAEQLAGVASVLQAEHAEVLSPPPAASGPSELLRTLGATSSLVVPVRLQGTGNGALVLLSNKPERSYDRTEIIVAEALSARIAMAIDNARLYREAQDAARLREEFLTIASHELRTPLTTLQLQVHAMLRRGAPTNYQDISAEKLKRFYESSDRQIVRLTRLVDGLLDVSRILRGRLQMSFERSDLVELVRQIVSNCTSELAAARCSVELHAEGPVVGWWDPLRIEQVITNLLSNAAKYGAGTPVKVTVDMRENAARIVVEDHGRGIANADQERIFRCFERAVSPLHISGFGVGLYVVQQIVRAHRGSIRVESELGAGAKFVIELPIHLDECD